MQTGSATGMSRLLFQGPYSLDPRATAQHVAASSECHPRCQGRARQRGLLLFSHEWAGSLRAPERESLLDQQRTDRSAWTREMVKRSQRQPHLGRVLKTEQEPRSGRAAWARSQSVERKKNGRHHNITDSRAHRCVWSPPSARRKDPSKASARPLPADPSQETFQPLKEEGGPCCLGKEGPVERSPQGHLLTVRPRLRLLVCV